MKVIEVVHNKHNLRISIQPNIELAHESVGTIALAAGAYDFIESDLNVVWVLDRLQASRSLLRPHVDNSLRRAGYPAAIHGRPTLASERNRPKAYQTLIDRNTTSYANDIYQSSNSY